MAAHIVADTYLFTGTGASVITFNPAVPAGASISTLLLAADGNGNATQAWSTAAASVTNLVQGSQQTTVVNVPNGTIATVAPLTINSFSVASGSSPDAVAAVTVTLSAAVTNGNAAAIQYVVSFD